MDANIGLIIFCSLFFGTIFLIYGLKYLIEKAEEKKGEK